MLLGPIRPSPIAPQALGPLEVAVLEILWARGESSVHQVVNYLARPLAYTTVMTTLDRLFKKGLLARRKSDRAFLYLPRFSRNEWDRRRASAVLDAWLSGPAPSGDLLVSCLVDAVGQRDERLLDELESRIRARRKELAKRREP
jgi:predicted transcriptional regulator